MHGGNVTTYHANNEYRTLGHLRRQGSLFEPTQIGIKKEILRYRFDVVCVMCVLTLMWWVFFVQEAGQLSPFHPTTLS